MCGILCDSKTPVWMVEELFSWCEDNKETIKNHKCYPCSFVGNDMLVSVRVSKNYKKLTFLLLELVKQSLFEDPLLTSGRNRY